MGGHGSVQISNWVRASNPSMSLDYIPATLPYEETYQENCLMMDYQEHWSHTPCNEGEAMILCQTMGKCESFSNMKYPPVWTFLFTEDKTVRQDGNGLVYLFSRFHLGEGEYVRRLFHAPENKFFTTKTLLQKSKNMIQKHLPLEMEVTFETGSCNRLVSSSILYKLLICTPHEM